MSAYSDWHCGAMTDDEYKYYSAWEARKDEYYEMREAEREYYNDDDEDYFDEDEYDD